MATSSSHEIDFTSFYNTINGQQKSNASARYGVNPNTGTELDMPFPVATLQNVEDAVCAARKASKDWFRSCSIAERRQKLRASADAVEKYKTELATVLTREHGMPSWLAERDILQGARWLRGTAELPFQANRKTVYHDNNGIERQATLSYTPLGVVVAIVPWNFPMQIACGKIASALLTGNATIVKPSPQAPYAILKLIEIISTFFPPGILQSLSGNDALGQWLTEHEGIDKITFTGSTAVGRKIMQTASQSMKCLTLELGGNDAAIICPSIDVAATAQQILTLAVLNSGQICVAPQRLYVHDSIHKDFLNAAVQFADNVKAVDGIHGGLLGPVQNKQQYHRLKALIDSIEHEGGRIVSKVPDLPDQGGFFINPVIVDQSLENARVVQEERFGPIVVILKWTEEDDVIQRVNNGRSGLGASVWSQDPIQAERIADQLEAGNIWINQHMELSPDLPFGGLKESGLGYEWGSKGLDEFCNVRTLFFVHTQQ